MSCDERKYLWACSYIRRNIKHDKLYLNKTAELCSVKKESTCKYQSTRKWKFYICICTHYCLRTMCMSTVAVMPELCIIMNLQKPQCVHTLNTKIPQHKRKVVLPPHTLHGDTGDTVVVYCRILYKKSHLQNTPHSIQAKVRGENLRENFTPARLWHPCYRLTYCCSSPASSSLDLFEQNLVFHECRRLTSA